MLCQNTYLGHTELITPEDVHKSASQSYYFPVHMVTKICSTTTKYRPVFDASASTTSGASFNDTLLTGPTFYPLSTLSSISSGSIKLSSLGTSARC